MAVLLALPTPGSDDEGSSGEVGMRAIDSLDAARTVGDSKLSMSINVPDLADSETAGGAKPISR